jgi:pimeloyl-ACP methyl ester carboxylesterase
MVERFRREGAEALVEADLWPKYVAQPHRSQHSAKSLISDMACQTANSDFAAQIELAINRPDSRPVLSGFKAPVLMVNGREDLLTPVDLGAEIAAAAHSGTHRVIPDAGHFVLLERPEAVSTAIQEWIAATVRS